MAAPNVKFPREIRQGAQGADVLAHKRAISRARPDLYEWADFTELAGDFFMDAVVAWKHSKGLGTQRVLGGVAHESLEKTHRHGYPDEWAFDATAIAQAQRYYDQIHLSPEQRIRNAGLAAMAYWYSKRMQTAYSQARPFWRGFPPKVSPRWDCSGFATNAHEAGGAKDPNDRNFDGEGYTGTLIQHGVRVGSVTELSVLDLIFYGHSVGKPGFNTGDPTHVAVYAGYVAGVGHMVYSLGSYPMRYTVYTYRSDLNQFRHYPLI